MLLGEPVSDLDIRIDHLAVTRAPDGSMALAPIPAGSMPAGPADNRVACMEDPNGASCIRFVRIRICAATAGDTCTALRYRSAFPFIDLPMSIPIAPTIVSAESLGFVPGMLPGSSATCGLRTQSLHPSFPPRRYFDARFRHKAGVARTKSIESYVTSIESISVR